MRSLCTAAKAACSREDMMQPKKKKEKKRKNGLASYQSVFWGNKPQKSTVAKLEARNKFIEIIGQPAGSTKSPKLWAWKVDWSHGWFGGRTPGKGMGWAGLATTPGHWHCWMSLLIASGFCLGHQLLLLP